MKFLLMCCIDEKVWENLPDSQRNKIMQGYGSLMGSLHRSGHLLTGAALDKPASAATVRQKNGETIVTDGPFAETKEQFGGYHLVECKDREEAIALAKRIPTLPVGGSIEVRAVLQMEV